MSHTLFRSLYCAVVSCFLAPVHAHTGSESREIAALQKKVDALNQTLGTLNTTLCQEIQVLNKQIQALKRQERERQDAPPATAYNLPSVRPTRIQDTECDDENAYFQDEDPHSSRTKEGLLCIDSVIENTQRYGSDPAGQRPTEAKSLPEGWVMGTLPPSSLPTQTSVQSDGSLLNPLQRAKLLLRNNKLKRARAALMRLIKTPESPAYPFAMYWLGILNVHENRLDDALSCFKATYLHCNTMHQLEHQKLCVSALLRMTTALIRKKEVDKAKTIFQQCQNQAQTIGQHLSKKITQEIEKIRIYLGQTGKNLSSKETLEPPSSHRTSPSQHLLQPAAGSTGIPEPASPPSSLDRAQEDFAFSDEN